jgi:carbon monoxide dehydrogenase subunit G
VITVQRTFTVVSPIERVFDYLADFTHTEQWDPGTVSCRRLDDGPLGVGARFHNVSRFRGRQTELEYRIVTYEPASHVVFEGRNKSVVSTDDLSFEPAADGTQMTYRARFEFQGLARLAEPFLRKSIDELAEVTVERLRSTLASV